MGMGACFFVPRTLYSARFSVPCLGDVHLKNFDVHLNIFVFALLYIYFLHGSAYVLALVRILVPTFLG
jgi:hypothetical protein